MNEKEMEKERVFYTLWFWWEKEVSKEKKRTSCMVR